MDESLRPSALEEFPVILQFPIQWGDMDVYGHVNNLVYLKWFEAARAVYASRVGVQVLPGQRGVGAIVGSVSCRYLRQLSYPGSVYSGVRIKRIGVGSIILNFRIVECSIGVPVAEGACDAVLYDYAARKPVPIPDDIRTAVEELEGKRFE